MIKRFLLFTLLPVCVLSVSSSALALNDEDKPNNLLISKSLFIKNQAAPHLESEDSKFLKSAAHDKLSAELSGLISEKKMPASGRGLLQGGAQSGPTTKNRTRVIFETDRIVDPEDIAAHGGTIIARRNKILIAEVALDEIENITHRVNGIEYARLPRKFYPYSVTSEGVNLSLANNLHSAGFKGANVKVAVIDVGFKGLTAAKANGEIPNSVISRDFTARGLETDTPHGTACAEIVFDMAPEAGLYLLKVLDETDIYDAFDYCVDNGIDVITMSIGTVGSGPGNGTGPVDEACDDVRAAGILIVAAAGNYGNTYSGDGIPIGFHWEGIFTDSNSNNTHEFKTTAYEYNPVVGFPSFFGILMRWDDWPYSSVDYDMYLYDYYTGALVASSTGSQNGSQPPLEHIGVSLPSDNEGTLYKLIVKKMSSAPVGKKLELYILGSAYFVPLDGYSSSMLMATSSGSLGEPADASSVAAVGAIRYSNWSYGPQEDFSSQGPTNNWSGSSARIKPDICGPDGVSGYTYGAASFFGTSASTPHVAGAAALILCMHPYLSPAQLQSVLESNAVDMGNLGKDNVYGSGKLKVRVYNNAPVLDYIGNKNVNENQLLSISLNAADTDNDSLTYSASNLPSGAAFDPLTRTFTWTPTFNQAGTYNNVHFEVSDGKNTDYENITITVNNVNRPPVLDNIGNKTVNEGQALNFTVSATDLDGQTLTYSASSLPPGASFDPATQAFSWIPTYDQAGMYYNVNFEVTDGADIDYENITITVNNVNRLPVLNNIGNKLINEGRALRFTISATDLDGDTLTYSASNLPAGASFNQTTRTLNWTPAYDQAGAYNNVRFEVTDGLIVIAEEITITVNDMPLGADIVIDNRDLECSRTSGWGYATSSQDYGVDYFAANQGTGSIKATWTPNLPTTANYEIFVWYVANTSRATNATYTVTHMTGQASVQINQQINGGRWVSIGTYSFNQGTLAKVVLTNNANGKVCTDAVKFVYRNEYTDIVIDNKSAGFTRTSGWGLNTSYLGYLNDYLAANAGTGSIKATWTPNLPTTSNYEIFVWYVANTSRATNATYTVTHMTGQTSIQINQQINGSKWVSIGTYSFIQGTTGKVVLTNLANGKVCADAVKFVYRNNYVDIVIDNKDAGFTRTSGWGLNTSYLGYLNDYLAANAGTGSVKATWTPNIPLTANYEVFVWYVSTTSRATNATYTVTHAEGQTPVEVNQQLNGSKWMSIGKYVFNEGITGKVVLTNNANGKVCADAVKFVYKE